MGRASQRKGRAGELELAEVLRGYGYPVEAGRAVSYGEVPDVSGLPAVHIECKRCQQLRISEWMQQATQDAEKFQDGAPVVFHRKDREGWLCTLRLDDFMSFYSRGAGDKQAR